MLGSKKKIVKPANPNRVFRAKLKIYRDINEEFRWRLLGSNGRIIADSSEGYASKWNCVAAVKRFKEAVATMVIVESSDDLGGGE